MTPGGYGHVNTDQQTHRSPRSRGILAKLRGNPAVVDEFFAGDYVNHDLSTPAVRGLEAFKQWAGAVRTSWAKGFPDYRITIEDLIAEDEKVAKRWTFRGTNTGEFMGMAPTGKQVMMRAVTIYCFDGGKVKEIWWNYDSAGLMQQLGGKTT